MTIVNHARVRLLAAWLAGAAALAAGAEGGPVPPGFNLVDGLSTPLAAPTLDDLGAGAPGDGADAPAAAFRVDLVPGFDAARPAASFPVAVVLRHAPGQYSYWKNPGTSGKATTFTWTKPAGFSVGEALWPAPRRYEAGADAMFTLDGDAAVFFLVTPPADWAPGAVAELAVAAEPLLCTTESCMPAFPPPVRVRVSAAADAADGDTEPFAADPGLAAAYRRLPGPPRGWRFAARRRGHAVMLEMFAGEGANPEPGHVDFFEDGPPDGLVAPRPAPVLALMEGGWRLTMPTTGKPAAGMEDATALRGTLVASAGWLEGDYATRAFAIDVPVERDGGEEMSGPGRQGGGAWMLLLAFLGGLVLNVMPCVFPVLGLKVMSMVRHAHEEHRAQAWHGAAYAFGVLLCFWVIAWIAISASRAWGVQLQSPVFVYAMALVFLVLALNMADVFEVGMINVGEAGDRVARQTGLKHSFFTGVLATLTSTPCSAPFLGAALAYALSLPTAAALGMFTVMALGFAAPYVLLTLFPACLRILPRPGRWMETLRKAMAFPLFGTAAYMAWVYGGLVEDGQLAVLLGLVAVAMGVWIYGHAQAAPPHAPARRRRMWTPLAGAVVALGIWWGWPRTREVRWEPWSPARVEALRAQGRTVYVDFTARWCFTCQTNKHVFDNRAVIERFAELDVAPLRADWTEHDAAITHTLRHEFNKAAVPVNVVYRPGEDAARVLPEVLTAGRVLAALE